MSKNTLFATMQFYLEDLHDWIKDSDVTPSHPQRKSNKAIHYHILTFAPKSWRREVIFDVPAHRYLMIFLLACLVAFIHLWRFDS